LRPSLRGKYAVAQQPTNRHTVARLAAVFLTPNAIRALTGYETILGAEHPITQACRKYSLCMFKGMDPHHHSPPCIRRTCNSSTILWGVIHE
jgi:hypothetical protein